MLNKNITTRLSLLLITGTLLAGCVSVNENQQALSSVKEREMTVGIVQKEIKVGMLQADVASALGSPNIITKDGGGKETWIYDKIATEASYSQSGAYGTLILVGASGNSGAYSTTQKTLTVIIKFDTQGNVASFSYHASKF
jgi:outer membrane protein assembly factor BamE (lipoprotein component of BamABCDE complex)